MLVLRTLAGELREEPQEHLQRQLVFARTWMMSRVDFVCDVSCWGLASDSVCSALISIPVYITSLENMTVLSEYLAKKEKTRRHVDNLVNI